MMIKLPPLPVCCLVLIVWLAAVGLRAQEPIQRFANCTERTFNGSQLVSSRICWDDARQWGIVRLYNRAGALIYERGLRRVAGHASIELSYHTNGAVYKADYSSAPDAGIQWHRSQTMFDGNGHRIGYTEQNNDDSPSTYLRRQQQETPPQPHVVPPPPTPKLQETIVCATIYRSRAWFINSATVPVNVQWTQDGKPLQITLAPGDTMQSGEVLQAEHFTPPLETQPVVIVPLRSRRYTNYETLLLKPLTQQRDPTITDYYYRIYSVYSRNKKSNRL